MSGQDDLRALGEARWAVAVLAWLLEQDGARFAELLGGLGLARDSLVRTLAHAMECGWVMRNPGYGHPLRPEYVLTATGRPVAGMCVRFGAAREALGIDPVAMSRWALPVIGYLREQRVRFSALRAGLAPVTSRALSMTLKSMIEGRVVDRQLEEGFPPSALYGLTPLGLELRRRFLDEG